MIAIEPVGAMEVPVLVFQDETKFELTPGSVLNDPGRVANAIRRWADEQCMVDEESAA